MLSTTIEAVFIGKLQELPSKKALSGIYKKTVSGTVSVHRLGLEGDEIADPNHHGGDDKALLYVPLESYPLAAKQFPNDHNTFVAGAFGENFSGQSLTAANVCIGDIFMLGSAKIQISEPRMPCWKIEDKLSLPGLANFLQKQNASGWYMRVLEEGSVAAGDSMTQLERPDGAMLLQDFTHAFWTAKDAQTYKTLAALPGLGTEWQEKATNRANKLKSQKHP